MVKSVKGPIVARPHRGVPVVLALLLALTMGLATAERSEASKAGANLFGVVPQDNFDPIDVALLQDSNAASSRVLVVWPFIQSSPGPCSPVQGTSLCDWARADQFIGGAAAGGAKPLPFMYGSLSNYGSIYKPPVRGAARAGWTKFLKAAVKRYGPGGTYWAGPYRAQYPGGGPPKPVKIWQIWNEPGSPQYWDLGKRPNPRLYAKLLTFSGKAINRAHKQAKIMMAGLFSGGRRPNARGRISAVPFLRKFYQARGAKKAFDIAGLHPYAANVKDLMTQVRQIRTVMNRAGDRRTKLAISEIGWASNRGRGLLSKGPRGQANLLKSAFRQLLRVRNRMRLSHVSWFALRDIDPNAGGGSCPNCPFAGLVNVDGSPKPAYRQFKRFTRVGGK